MSNDEQLLMIGRLVRERVEATRELALLSRKLKEAGSILQTVGIILNREPPPEHPRAFTSIDELVKGGFRLEVLSAWIAAERDLIARIADLSKCLRDAGVE